MSKLFSDLPESIHNIQEIIEKVEPIVLAREVLLPKFDIPDEFIVAEDQKDGGKRGENKYLKHLTQQGAKFRYGEISKRFRKELILN